MTVEELQVIVTARTRGLEQQMQGLTRQLQGVQRQTNTMSTNMTRTFTNLKRTLIGLGVGKAIKSMFNLSRTYEAATMQVNRIFKENASAIEAWIQKNAMTFGMARADAMEYASIYGNLVKGFEKDTAKMSQYTTQLLEATTIIASNTGRTVKDVSERIRSGLLGNTEAIEDLGIYAQVAMLKTSNAFKTIANGRTWENLTFQEQQQVRLMSILEQSASQFGTNIQQNMNYQLMQLTVNLKNVALNLGNAFAPIVNAILPALNAMALALANVTNKIASFMNALFGTNFNTGAGQVQQVATGASDAASGYEDMANAADDAGESAKKAGQKAKNAIMGFDEINSLTQSSGSGDSSNGSGGSGVASDVGVVTSTAMSEAAESFSTNITDVINRLKNLFKEGFEIGLGNGWQAQVDDIKKSIEGIKSSLKDIFMDSEVASSAQTLVEDIVLNLGKVTGSAVSIGTTLAQNLIGGIDVYLAENSQFIRERLVGIFDASSEVSNLIGEFCTTYAEVFSTMFGGETAQQITANIIGVFSNVFLTVLELAVSYSGDIIKAITDPFINNKDEIKTAFEGLLSVIDINLQTIKDTITNTCETVLGVYDEYISPAIDNISSGIDRIVKSLLDAWDTHIQPTLIKVGEGWSELYSNHMQPVIDKAIKIIGQLIESISEIWDKTLAPFISWIIDTFAPRWSKSFEDISNLTKSVVEIILGIISGLLDSLSGVITFLTGVFTGDWSKAWEGIKATFKGIVDTFEATFKDPLDKGLTWVENTFITGWQTTCNRLKTKWENMWSDMKSGAKTAINWIIDKLNGFIRGINNKLSFDLPEIMGGAHIGFSIPEIPKLARGGIVDSPTLAMVGEAGPEAVVPLENTSFVDKLASSLGNAVMSAMSTAIGTGINTESGQNVSLEMDGTVFARTVTPYVIKEMKRLGFV